MIANRAVKIIKMTDADLFGQRKKKSRETEILPFPAPYGPITVPRSSQVSTV